MSNKKIEAATAAIVVIVAMAGFVVMISALLFLAAVTIKPRFIYRPPVNTQLTDFVNQKYEADLQRTRPIDSRLEMNADSFFGSDAERCIQVRDSKESCSYQFLDSSYSASDISIFFNETGVATVFYDPGVGASLEQVMEYTDTSLAALEGAYGAYMGWER